MRNEIPELNGGGGSLPIYVFYLAHWGIVSDRSICNNSLLFYVETIKEPFKNPSLSKVSINGTVSTSMILNSVNL